MGNTMQTARKINKIHLSLCLLCISWINGGFFSKIPLFGFFAFIAIFAMWFIMAISNTGYKLTVDNVWLYIYVAVILLSSVFLTPFLNKHTYLVVYLLIISMFSAYYTRSGLAQERRVIWTFYLVEICAICVVSTFLCALNPNIARMYAGGMGENMEVGNYLLAEFGMIYTLPLIIVFFVFSYPKLANKKLAWTIFPMFICLYFVNFATALFILILFLLVAFLAKKPVTICFLLGVSVLLFVIFRFEIADFCRNLASMNFLGKFVSYKLINIADTINGVTVYQDSNTLNMRIDYTTDALRVFKNHPLLGIYGINAFAEERILLRDHNVWFDALAYFGVIRIFPYIAFIIKWYKNVQKRTKHRLVYPVAYVTIIWVMYGFLNPMNKYQVLVFMHMMLPMSAALLAEVNEEDKL